MTEPKVKASKSSGIKPYLEKGEASFNEMMNRRTQTAADWRQKKKHSEMVKPYLVDPAYPWPALEDIEPIPLNIENPNTGEDWQNVESWGEEAYKFQCIIGCTASIQATEKNCEKPIRCTFGAWTPVPNPCKYLGKVELAENTPNYLKGSDIRSLIQCKWHAEMGLNGELWIWPAAAYAGSWAGVFTELGLDLDTGDNVKIKITYKDKGQKEGQYFDPNVGKWITIAAGNSFCDDTVWQGCQQSQCPPEVTMTVDTDTTPTEMDPNDSVTVAVQDGLGPYTWEVSGTGYSLDNASTAGVTNTLNCVDGTCGDEFDYSCTVTVTDACGTEVNFVVRNTDGSWTQQQTKSFGLSGSNCGGTIDPTCYTTPNSYDLYDGNEKWTLEGMGPSPNGNCRLNPGSDNWASGATHPPPCGGPMACHPNPHDADCADPDGCTCYVDHYYYYTFGC